MGPTKLDAAHDNDQQTTLGQNNQHFVLDDFEILKTIGELRRHLFVAHRFHPVRIWCIGF